MDIVQVEDNPEHLAEDILDLVADKPRAEQPDSDPMVEEHTLVDREVLLGRPLALFLEDNDREDIVQERHVQGDTDHDVHRVSSSSFASSAASSKLSSLHLQTPKNCCCSTTPSCARDVRGDRDVHTLQLFCIILL